MLCRKQFGLETMHLLQNIEINLQQMGKKGETSENLEIRSYLRGS